MSISQAVYEAQIQRIADLQARLAEAEHQWKYWMGVADEQGVKSLKAQLAEAQALYEGHYTRPVLGGTRRTRYSFEKALNGVEPHVAGLQARLSEAEALLRDVAAVVHESTGVYGFHMNGDLERWDYWPVFARIDAHLGRDA